MNRELPKLLRTIRDRFASQEALARAIGISSSRLGRAMAGMHTLNVLSCLRLAKASGENAATILRAAGKAEIAELLEELYGQTSPALAVNDRVTLARLRSLTREHRRTIDAVLTQLAVAARPGTKPRGTRSSAR